MRGSSRSSAVTLGKCPANNFEMKPSLAPTSRAESRLPGKSLVKSAILFLSDSLSRYSAKSIGGYSYLPPRQRQLGPTRLFKANGIKLIPVLSWTRNEAQPRGTRGARG